MGLQGKEHMRTKIVINEKTIEQVRDFNYQGCNIYLTVRERLKNEGKRATPT